MITMTKTEEKQKELEAKIVELEELVQELNDEIDAMHSKVGMIDEIIAAWNSVHPEEHISQPQSHNDQRRYTMTDEEWKKATRVAHPSEGRITKTLRGD